jgi:general secretion pathway protein C
MSAQASRPWALYFTTFLASLLAAGSAVFWVMGILAVSAPEPGEAPQAARLSAPQAHDLARALGGGLQEQAATALNTSTQYQLFGVVAGPLGAGYALVAIDGAPPKAYRVGDALGSGQVLRSVGARGAKLGPGLQGEATLELNLPKPSGG